MAASQSETGNSQPNERVLIRCGLLIDGTGNEPYKEANLIVDGDTIAAVTSDVSSSSYDRVVDYAAHTVMPGMIDTHVHLVFNPLATHAQVIDDYVRADDRDLTIRALRNAQAALRGGVTTLRDCGDRDFVTLSVKRAIDAGVVPGPRLWIGGPPITTTAGHCHFLGGETDTKDQLLVRVRSHVKRGADFIKVMATGGNMTPGSNNRSCQYSADELRLITDESHRLNKRVAAHVLATEGIRRALDAGIDTLEHCTWLAPSEEEGLEYDPQTVRKMATSPSYWSNTMTGIFRGLVKDEPLAMPRELVLQWCRHFREMFDAGVKMMISSDAGVRITRFDEFAVGVEAATRFMELPEMTAIEAVTRIPAAAMGLESQLGTLEAGKRADLLVLDGDPLEDIRNLRRVRRVIKDGRVVV